MSNYGNWHTKSHKNPESVPMPNLTKEQIAWLGQAKLIHESFGKDGLLAFFRKSEERDGLAKNSLDSFLTLFNEVAGMY